MFSGTYTYNTYGAVSAHTGTATTPLQYGGGYTDAETGLIYLQARYYDPVTGLFLTIDPELATTGQPYAYVADDPLNDVDPLGLWGWNPISDVKQAAKDTGHFIAKHKDTIAKVAGTVGAVAGIAALTIATGGADTPFLAATVFALDATATAGGAVDASIDCPEKGVSLQCGLDIASAALGGAGAWGDFGFAPELWGYGFGLAATAGGVWGVDLAFSDGGSDHTGSASSSGASGSYNPGPQVYGSWNGETVEC